MSDEIVFVTGLVASYRTNWVEVARTSAAERLQIGQVLRRRNHGAGSEQLKIEALSEGRVYLLRGEGPSPVQYHEAGTVFEVLEDRHPTREASTDAPVAPAEVRTSAEAPLEMVDPSKTQRRADLAARLVKARAARAAKRAAAAFGIEEATG